MCIKEIISILGVVATFSAVLVALFKDKPRKPKYSLLWKENTPPFCTKSILIDGEEFSAYYCRAIIKNDTNKTLNDVSIYIKELLFKNISSNKYELVPDFVSMNLVWTNTYAMDRSRTVAQHLSPGMEKVFEIGVIAEPRYRSRRKDFQKPQSDEMFLFEMEVEAKTYMKSHLLQKGNYIINIMIFAENAKPISKTIELNFSRTWESIEELISDDNFIKMHDDDKLFQRAVLAR